MITDIIKQLSEAIKLGPAHLVAIALVLGVILWAPAEFAQWLGIVDVAKDYRPGIGIGFLLCFALLIVSPAKWIKTRIMKYVSTRQFKSRLDQRLRALTEDEKQILRYYIQFQTRANTLRVDDGVVQGLVGGRVIFRSANLGDAMGGFAHNINEIAWQTLNKEPELLAGTSETYRTDKGDDDW